MQALNIIGIPVEIPPIIPPELLVAVMTFPSILEATQSPISGAAALLTSLALAWWGKSLFQVSVFSCAVVFFIELFL